MRDLLSLFYNNQADVVEAFNSTSTYLDDLVNSDMSHVVSQIYSTQLQLIRRIFQILKLLFYT